MTQYKESGPVTWDQNRIDKERFLITDILDDIKFPKNREEQIPSAIHLYEPLMQFYFRASKNWTASGKSIIRLLNSQDPGLAAEFHQSFQKLINSGDATGVESIVLKILLPYGGFFWDCFRSNALPEWEITSTCNMHK